MNLKKKSQKFIEATLDYLFPVRLGRRNSLFSNTELLKPKLLELLDRNVEQSHIKNEEVVKKFCDYLPRIKESLIKDIEAIYDGDPAAKTRNEIILAYPGFQATACYRIAHFLLEQGVGLLPRIITEYAHSETGVDIHPGAQIGAYFCIDHGTGIVIGETTVIGNHVKIYQGVTLGALSVPDRSECAGKRHPTIGDRVVIYAQAIILGGETEIGEGSVIGGNTWITTSVPPNSKVYFDNKETRTITSSEILS